MIESEEENDAFFEHHRLVADAGQTSIRLDKFLMDRLPNVSRNKIQKGIKFGFTKVNDQPVKANYKVRPEDVISVSFLQPPRD